MCPAAVPAAGPGHAVAVAAAIAIAGGYSYRAKKGVVFVRRGDSDEEIELDVNGRVQPGDIIRVAERLF